jgi:CheY-like chemotaxis protein
MVRSESVRPTHAKIFIRKSLIPIGFSPLSEDVGVATEMLSNERMEANREQNAEGRSEKMTQPAINPQTVEISDELNACCRDTQAASEGAETILFVEDEAFVRGATAEVLRSAGYRVLAARDALEAASAYDARPGAVDLLVADMILPGENGCVLARRLKLENSKLKILLISGYADQLARCKAGIGEYLAKPFSVAVLLRRVRQVLDDGKFEVREHAGSDRGLPQRIEG